ncbi:hypothetical protein L228DRAFT_239453 [Xylona heveae TC161]|uniref:PHD-type domain-containing protein n=1 Tax=Xylona heveae (strain CBS 132557 / TC161) TaxID=1328760 RepID=A0A165FWR4_XYLHT|nr:hypothetical protein L228DRAFT_239453 [Xylona heveae TC161]KZF21478.1 hypothetical protein L228DRAFT_239453 [Xylona heveae TC161]
MASTRPTRKSSRMSSPFTTSQKDASLSAANKPKEEKKTFLDKWVEPPLRQPAPSFEDYKGLERHGVLEHMAPLGALPSAKVKARVKIEGPRRAIRGKKRETAAAKERAETPDSSASANTRRSESRKIEEKPSATSLLQEEAAERSFPPSPSPGSGVKAVTAAKTSIASTSEVKAPDSRTPAGRAKLELIVQAAVRRASELGNPALGLAIKQLHTESLQRRDLADLLDAVLSQRSTPRQTGEFQAYITQARKQIKSQNSTLNGGRRLSVPAEAHSTTKSSKSPSKGSRSAVTTATGNNVSPLEATGPNQSDKPKSNQKESVSSGKRRQANGMASQENIPLTRSKSASSSSSLSSMTSMDHEFTASMDAEPGNAQVAETYASSPPMNNDEPHSATGPKLDLFSTSNPPTSNSLKRSSAAAGLTQPDSDDTLMTKRKRMSRAFDDYKVTESNVRVETKPQQENSQEVTPTTKPSNAPTVKQTLRLRNSTRKSARHEPEQPQSPSSSVTGGPRSPAPALIGSASRASTPILGGRPLKKNKKGARIKMSPSKKKSGVIAGIARGGGAARNSLGYGPTDENEDSENDEFCSACGGSGYLLCCDGCDRSFHFTCLDPPLDPNRPPDDSWYCFICESKRGPPTQYSRGLFAALFGNLEKKNPVAFNLPREIREYFEGVRTGDEGEYEEAVTQKSKPRGGYEEFPDLLKLRDSKGKYVLCFRCGKSALNNREIIPCDFCSLQWHLDCLDPPMANPPPKALNGKSKHNWMCPNHVDHELLALDPSVRQNAKQGTAGIGRMHKVRRPKNARIVDPALRRGFINNGLIEIDNDSSDEDDFHDQEEFGVVYRLPERGVKLDFIDKVKRTCWTEIRPSIFTRPGSVDISEANPPVSAELQMKIKSEFDRRSFADRQLALNLAQLSGCGSNLSLSADAVENLINTLIAEAPSDVASLMIDSAEKASNTPPSPPASDSRLGQSEAGPVSDKERNTLLMLQELIRRRLETSSLEA